MPAPPDGLAAPPVVAAAATDRVRYLDTARAAMLLLGIPFHASEPYRLSGQWLISSPDASFVATAFCAAVHAFRMPAFFVLAGFFAAMLLERRTDRAWLADRFLRLGVPLAFSLLAFGWLEASLARAASEGVTFAEAVRATLGTSPLAWSHHRWFLFVLLLHCVGAVAARRLLPGGALERTLGALGAQPYRPWRAAAALVALSFAIVGFGALPWADGVVRPDGTAHDDFHARYAILFVVGYGAYRAGDARLDRFLAFGRADRVIAIGAIGTWLALYPGFHAPGGWLESAVPAPATLVARTAVESLAGFHAARLFLAFARRRLDVRAPAIAYLVDGALCIYLVHETFVLTFAGLLLTVAWPPILEIALITGGALALSVLAFELVRRVAWLSLALNGRTVR